MAFYPSCRVRLFPFLDRRHAVHGASLLEFLVFAPQGSAPARQRKPAPPHPAQGALPGMAILDRRAVATQFAVPGRFIYDKAREKGSGRNSIQACSCKMTTT